MSIIRVRVADTFYALSIRDLQKYPRSTLSCAYRFNNTKDNTTPILDFSYRCNDNFSMILQIYRDDCIILPEHSLCTDMESVKDDLLFWGFDVVHPISISQNQDSYVLREASEHGNGDAVLNSKLNVKSPWALAVKDLAQYSYMPLLAFYWHLILSNSNIIEIASLGYVSVSIFVRHGTGEDDSTCASLVTSRQTFFQELARLAGCQVFIGEGCFGHNIQNESKLQDVYTNSDVTCTWEYVQHFDAMFECHHDMNRLRLSPVQKQALLFTVQQETFEVDLEIQDGSLKWKIRYHKDSDIHLAKFKGFQLKISFVVDNTITNGFLIPSCSNRFFNLDYNLYKAKCYEEVSNDSLWFTKHGQYSTSVPFISTWEKDIKKVTLLVEKAGSDSSLNIKRVSHQRNSSINSNAYYERVVLSW
jgi:hypothetical protein